MREVPRDTARSPPRRPVSGGGDIPIAPPPSPERLPMSSPPPPPAAPIAGSARERTQTQTQDQQQLQQQQRSRFLEVEPEQHNNTSRPAMPSAVAPDSPPPASAKWSRARARRVSIRAPKRLPQPLPSPTVHDGFDGQPRTPPPPAPTENLDVERGTAGATKRKTLFQRALEGWWELPGLLGRSDTLKGRPGTVKGRSEAVRGKVQPFPARKAPAGGFI
jgi:hypothetical protein